MAACCCCMPMHEALCDMILPSVCAHWILWAHRNAVFMSILASESHMGDNGRKCSPIDVAERAEISMHYLPKCTARCTQAAFHSQPCDSEKSCVGSNRWNTPTLGVQGMSRHNPGRLVQQDHLGIHTHPTCKLNSMTCKPLKACMLAGHSRAATAAPSSPGQACTPGQLGQAGQP